MKKIIKQNSGALKTTTSNKPKRRAKKELPVDFASAKSEAAQAIEVSAVSDRNGTSPTVIEARFDAGFGNGLFVRGEGAGLSWEKGEPMICLDRNVSAGWDPPALALFLKSFSTIARGPLAITLKSPAAKKPRRFIYQPAKHEENCIDNSRAHYRLTDPGFANSETKRNAGKLVRRRESCRRTGEAAAAHHYTSKKRHRIFGRRHGHHDSHRRANPRRPAAWRMW
jgi:hypothetical protein